MDDKETISDEEQLYRGVRGELRDNEYTYDSTGRLKIRSNAFRDRNKKPSVDRANLREFKPSLSRLNETDGIVTLLTADVRAIGDVTTRIDETPVRHRVDVEYAPLAQNPAHSQIVVCPEYLGSKTKQENAFYLLRVALARLATINGWTLRPGEH
jgi:hypothetical protein